MGEPLTVLWQAIRHPDSYILLWAEGSRPPDEPWRPLDWEGR